MATAKRDGKGRKRSEKKAGRRSEGNVNAFRMGGGVDVVFLMYEILDVCVFVFVFVCKKCITTS